MTRALVIVLLLALTGFLVSTSLVRGPAPSAPNPGATSPATPASPGTVPSRAPAPPQALPQPAPTVVEKAPPQRARLVLAEIQRRQGEPPPGYVGGRAFQNREGQLPHGIYREYDVNPKVAGRDRGPERIVIEQHTGKAYYTGDHYQTFIPLN